MTLKVGMIKTYCNFLLQVGTVISTVKGRIILTHILISIIVRMFWTKDKKWMFIGQIQPFDEKLYGETLTKSGNYHYLAIQYNTNNFSFGIGAFNPFRNVSRTIIENKNNQSPFRRESFSSASQTIVATLRWNYVSFKVTIQVVSLLKIRILIMV